MSPRTTSLVTAVVAALLYSGWEYHDRRSHFKEVARLRAENERLRHSANPPDDAKSQPKHDAPLVAQSSTAPDIPNGVADESASPPNADRTNPRSETIARYRNEGRNAPVPALQTLAWACDNGDAAAMQTLIAFDDAARAKAAAYHASLPADVRGQWPTLEALAAAVMIADGIRFPYPDAAVIEQARQESIRPGRVVLLLPGTRHERVEFQQFPDGWKRVITEEMVDEYLADLAQSR